MDVEDPGKLRRSRKKSTNGGDGERRKSKNKKKSTERDEGRTINEVKRKKKSRKSSLEHDDDYDGENPRLKEQYVQESISRYPTNENGRDKEDEIKPPVRKRSSTVVPNLAQLVGTVSEQESEEPFIQPVGSRSSDIVQKAELVSERDGRRREAARRKSTDNQSNDSSAFAGYSAITTTSRSSNNSLHASSEKPYANAPSRVGAIAVTGGSQSGKHASLESAGRESYGTYQQRPGVTAVSGAAPRGKSGMRNLVEPRVGAVHVHSAAPRGKGMVSVSTTSESYDSRVGAVSVSMPAPQGKRSATAQSMSANQDSQVGAMAVGAPAPRGKGEPAVSLGAESYTQPSTSSAVGAMPVSGPAPRGKGGPSVSSGSESRSLSSTPAVGAMSVSGPAPRGKGGPALSSGAESYTQSSLPSAVGAMSISGPAPRGKGDPSLSTASDSYNQQNRVGATSMASAAPRGKRTSKGSTTSLSSFPESNVGAVSVPSAAPRGKGRLSLSSASESYEEESERISRWSSIPSVTSRDSTAKVGAKSVRGAPSSSKSSKNGGLQVMEGDETYGESSVRVSSVSGKGKAKQKQDFDSNEGMEQGAVRRSSGGDYSETASSMKSRVSHFPTSDLYASLSSINEPSGDNKGRISQFPGEENYEEDVETHSMSKVRRRDSNGSSRRKSGGNNGPSYSVSGDSYDRDTTRSGSGDSLHPEMSVRSMTSSGSHHSQEQGRRRSAGAFFISGDTVLEMEPGTITPADQLGSNNVLDAEAIPMNEWESRNVAGVSSDELKRKPWYRTWIFLLIALLLAVIGLTCGLVFGLGVFQTNNDTPPSLSPLMLIDEDRKSEILIIVTNVTDDAALSNPTSPQSEALGWIVAFDSLTPVTKGAVSPEERTRVETRYALATFFYATTGARWLSSKNWLDPAVDECQWEFISCKSGVISEILINEGNNLVGSIPSEVQLLSSLTEIKLRSNRINAIDSNIARLADLSSLDLNANDMYGTLPAFLYSMTELTVLDLGENQLNGTIPEEISSLSNLFQLSLSINSFSGTITSELAGLSNLRVLDLARNRLAGDFHSIISGMTSLIYILMDENQFSGKLNSTLLLPYADLEQLILSSNKLSGTIPSDFGSMSSLSYLAVDSNQLSGTIPSGLAGSAPLESISLDTNKLTGSVPIEICGISTLMEIYVDCSVACSCEACIQTCYVEE